MLKCIDHYSINILNIKRMQFKNFIGIDVSKLTLDVSLVVDGVQTNYQQIKNEEKSIKKYFSSFLKHAMIEDSIVCMEFTGIYNERIINYLNKINLMCWMESGLQIKLSQGFTRGKSDKVDALRIAMYAYTHQHKVKVYKAPRTVIKKLSSLIALRTRIIKATGNMSKSLSELQLFGDKETLKVLHRINTPIIKQLQKQLLAVDLEIKETIYSDEKLKRLFILITSVPGVGIQTAVNIITTTNEFISITDAKKFACYSGVVPFEHSSGTSIRGKHKVSQKANKSMKCLLHMAAISNMTCKSSDLKDYYLRKVGEGKNKMSVINAVRNKIVLRIFSCVKNNKPYERYLVKEAA